jgi:Flp pilus assembly protein TadG
MRHRRQRDDAGVTTVEFALVLPMFVLLVGIATYFAWMFYVQAQVDRAADRAARYAAVPYYSTTTQNVTDSTTGLTYAKTVTTANYAFCVSKVVDNVNGDLVTGSVSAGDVTVADGSGVITSGAACAKPNGYVKVQLSKDFTNPFSYLLAPFTGTTSQLTVSGTGRARVEAE